MRSAALALVLATLAACQSKGAAPEAAAPAPERPNFLVIVLDDLGTEQLAMYGQSASTPATPRLDELRSRGILFTNAYTNPVCCPSRAAFQTGRYGFRTGIGRNILPRAQFELASSEVTLAEMLREGVSPRASYACAAFGKWHLARFKHPEHPNENGYEHFAGSLANVRDGGNEHDHFFWRKVVDGKEVTVGSLTGPRDESTWNASVNRRDAVEWIGAQTRPFLAWVAFQPPHMPFQVPPLALVSPSMREELETRGLAQGDLVDDEELQGTRRLVHSAMIEAIDSEVGRLLDEIDPATLARTTVFVFGDNGTEPSVLGPPFNSMHTKGSPYQLGTRVPMLVAGPGIPANATCKGLIGAVDLWSTLAELSGADVARALPAGTKIDGVSFARMLVDPSAPSARAFAFCEIFGPRAPRSQRHNPVPIGECLRAVQDGRFKYMRLVPNTLSGAVAEELYDLANDPDEQRDLLREPALTDEQSAALARLRTELDRILAS